MRITCLLFSLFCAQTITQGQPQLVDENQLEPGGAVGVLTDFDSNYDVRRQCYAVLVSDRLVVLLQDMWFDSNVTFDLTAITFTVRDGRDWMPHPYTAAQLFTHVDPHDQDRINLRAVLLKRPVEVRVSATGVDDIHAGLRLAQNHDQTPHDQPDSIAVEDQNTTHDAPDTTLVVDQNTTQTHDQANITEHNSTNDTDTTTSELIESNLTMVTGPVSPTINPSRPTDLSDWSLPGEQWLLDPYIGWVYIVSTGETQGWLYHETHGWLYIDGDNDQHDVQFWCEQAGWFQASHTLQPYAASAHVDEVMHMLKQTFNNLTHVEPVAPDLVPEQTEHNTTQTVQHVPEDNSTSQSVSVTSVEHEPVDNNTSQDHQWVQAGNLGWIYITPTETPGAGWIFHETRGWMYMNATVSSDVTGAWFWTNSAGWFWTSADLYPHVWDNQHESIGFVDVTTSDIGTTLMYVYRAEKWHVMTVTPNSDQQ